MDVPYSLSVVPVCPNNLVPELEKLRKIESIHDVLEILPDFFRIRVEMGPVRLSRPGKLII